MNKTTLITAIIEPSRCDEVLSSTLYELSECVLSITARGTLIRDKWIQKLLPAINPKKIVLNILTPSENEEQIIQHLYQKANLHQFGSGALMSFECEQTHLRSTLAEKKSTNDTQRTIQIPLKKELVLIQCITQKGKADKLAKEAMNYGVPGPIIEYGQGKGVRDKLGLLRIAINPQKEILTAIVDECDLEMVFEGLSREGRFHIPGEGLIYAIPITQGRVNIASIRANFRQAASIQQMIKAIDELKGNKHWRKKVIEKKSSSSKSSLSTIKDLKRVTCIVDSEVAQELVQEALRTGAPGASMKTAQLHTATQTSKGGVTLNQEKEIIEFIIKNDMVQTLINTLSTHTTNKSNPAIIFTHDIPLAFTYHK